MPITDDDLPVNTLNEAAGRLRVSRSTIERLVRDHEIEITRIGKRPFITNRAILDYLNRGVVRPTSKSRRARTG